MGNNLFARLRVAWLTSQAPNNEKWFTNDYEYFKNLLAYAGKYFKKKFFFFFFLFKKNS